MNLITLGKFTNNIEFKEIEKTQCKKSRVSSLNPNKLIKLDYIPISTNGNSVIYENKKFTLELFLEKVRKDSLKPLIVLTNKEHALFLPYLIDYDLVVSVLEQKFPIFENLKYHLNIEVNYKILINKLTKLKSLNINYKSLAKFYSTKHQYEVERKVRFKNNYDRYFALAYQGGYQEVFKLKEERQDRCVIALDYNSMFVSCMDGDFLKPQDIKHVTLKPIKTDLNHLENGLYRVKLKKPKDTFFKHHHPFKYTTTLHSLSFKLSSEDCIDLLLFKNELEYYSQFFQSFEIVEGFVSEETIPHPLYKKGCNIYKKRIKARKEGKKELSNLYKYQLLTMHSATNSSKFKKKRFKDVDDLLNFLFIEFTIKKPKKVTILEFIKFLQVKKYFKISNINSYFELAYPDFSSSIQVHSISAQILANSRIKMMKLIEELLDFPTLEICYANVDSIHVSIQQDHFDDFMKINKDNISENLGKLKVQAIGNKGYWFDIGRYWIKNNNDIVTYANSGFNHSGNNNPFIKVNKKTVHNKISFFEFYKIYFRNITDSFSYSKKLIYVPNNDTGYFDRFNYDDIFCISSMTDTITNEKVDSKQNKIELLNIISS
jgi:hypothetical protein